MCLKIMKKCLVCETIDVIKYKYKKQFLYYDETNKNLYSRIILLICLFFQILLACFFGCFI